MQSLLIPPKKRYQNCRQVTTRRDLNDENKRWHFNSLTLEQTFNSCALLSFLFSRFLRNCIDRNGCDCTFHAAMRAPKVFFSRLFFYSRAESFELNHLHLLALIYSIEALLFVFIYMIHDKMSVQLSDSCISWLFHSNDKTKYARAVYCYTFFYPRKNTNFHLS